MMQEVTINRKNKDRLFRRLFDGSENKENLLSLYNAVNGTDYASAENLEITTIDDVIYLGMKNDVSFIIDHVLSMYEHQSTFCPNMPLRGFLYAARLYEQFLVTRKLWLYGKTKLSIPAPRYVVFYNGNDAADDVIKLSLSDMFEPSMTAHDQACRNDFEWTAVMLNINLGHNKELLEKCRTLREYSIYTDKLNRYQMSMPIAEAADLAVTECIREGVLEEFLRKHRSEVLELILTEYDEKEAMERFFEDGLKQGMERGMEKKAMESAANLKKAGVADDVIAKAVGLPLEVVRQLV